MKYVIYPEIYEINHVFVANNSLLAVMSMNIRVFKYLNKMALEFYLYLYLCHFPSTNIFIYSFVDLKKRLYLNICS